jgi:hypothetical protein
MNNLQDTYEANGIDPFDAPIPGESLTSDPNTPRAWERPPEFTDVNEALKDIFIQITEDGTYQDFLDMMREEVPLDMITQTILFRGYMVGKWNTDMMFLLVEPTLYLLIALAEQNGINDYLVYAEENDEFSDEELKTMVNEDIERMKPRAPKKPMKVPEEVVPNSLLSNIKPAKAMEGEE